MNLLFELTYSMYPLIRDLVLYPIMGMYFLLYQFMDIFLKVGLYTFVDTLIRTLFFAVGVIFMQYATSFLLKKSSLRARRNMRNVFLGVFTLSLAWEGFAHFFSETVLVRAIYASNIVQIYAGIYVIGMGALLFFVLRFITNFFLNVKSERIQKAKLSLLVLAGLYPILVLSIFVIEIFIDPIGSPAASRYFVLNAAIKNTCIIDTEQENCPQTLEEIGYIEPQHFKEMMNNAQAHYEYYPESNEYVLVIRYSPTRAVIFSPRLIEQHSIDFHEYEVDLLGEDEIANPPNFEGPWQFEDWDYSRYLK